MGSYPSAEVQSVYSTALADLATRTLIWRGSYPSAEVQSVYSTAPADWATRTLIWRESLTLLQRCNRCIIQPNRQTHIRDSLFATLGPRRSIPCSDVSSACDQHLKNLTKVSSLTIIVYAQLFYSIFIIKGFRIIVLIFIVISTTFRPICSPAFSRCFLSKFLGRSLMIFII